jgi:hypothetical protein
LFKAISVSIVASRSFAKRAGSPIIRPTMNAAWVMLFVAMLCVLLSSGCSTTPGPRSFPAPAALPPCAALPDPLVMLDGRRVSSPGQWFDQRRPELMALFQHYMYGTLPPKPAQMRARVVAEFDDFAGGKATLRLITLETGSNGAPQINLMLVLPNHRPGRVPVFLGLNFCGNQSLTDDPRVPLARGWLTSLCKGCSNNVVTEAARSAGVADWPGDEWPIADIVERGYGLATFCSCDIDSDRPDVSDGLYQWLAGGDPARNRPADRGTIAAWAWGFQCCVDYLETDPAVDPRHIAALGHSRNGKAALLAAAFDDRIALVVVHQAGCGGSAPSRGKTGEQLHDVNRSFPHWFNAEFKQFNDCPQRLPFDQNCLVALCAPRAVLFSNGQADQWANPAGQFDVLQAAAPVYRLLGVDGLAPQPMPAPGQLAGDHLGYYIRPGGHSMTPADWTMFMDFADRQWGKPAR